MLKENDNWCFNEFASLQLGDRRLNQRLKSVANDLLNQPRASIQTATEDWPKAKGAYRLLDNNKLTESHLLKTHQVETMNRFSQSEEELFFAIQDSTTLNYTHHPKKKIAGKLHQKAGFLQPMKGFFLHNTLLLAQSGLPLGLLDQKIYQHSEKAADHKRRPIIEKESYRWIEALKNTNKLTQGKKVITLCDRESDIYEFFVEAESLNEKVLVRAGKDRILVETNDKKRFTLWTYMKKQPIAMVEKIHIPARHNKPARDATLDIRFATVTLKAPQRYPGAKIEKLPNISIQAVWLYESNPPTNNDRLEWMLLTNNSVTSNEEALKIGKWYRFRWQIECYHRILKSGCKVEDCRLETYDRLKKYLTLKSIIAFRLFWLTMINRTNPTMSCEKILANHEWKSLYCHIHKVSKPTEKPPSASEAIRMVAKLGGFLGRKNDKEPGMTYIWRGWEKLTEIAKFWLTLRGDN